MAGLTPFQFSSGKRMYNCSSGTTTAYGSDLFADAARDAIAWQEMWINPNNVKWDSAYRQSQKQTAQSIVTFHFRPDFQVISCSGRCGWFRIKSQLEELQEAAIKTAVGAIGNTKAVPMSQVNKDESVMNDRKKKYDAAKLVDATATNKHIAVSKAYGDSATESTNIKGYIDYITTTLTDKNYNNYNIENTIKLIALKTTEYLAASGSTETATLFSSEADIASLISTLSSAFANAEKSKTDIAADTQSSINAKTISVSSIKSSTAAQIKSVLDYIKSLTLSDTEKADIDKMGDLFVSELQSVSAACLTDVDVLMNMSDSIVTKISTYNKSVPPDPIVSLNDTYASNINAAFTSLTSKLAIIKDASHEDAPQDVYVHMTASLSAASTSFVESLVLVESASLKLIADHNDAVAYTSDVELSKKNLDSATSAILASAKAANNSAKLERQNADIALAQAKSNYEAAVQKYKNSKGGMNTIKKAASDLKSSYKTGATKPNSFLKSDYANRTNNSPSLFLSRLKLTADEPMYYIDKEGVEHYNPKYIKMFTKQYPDGIIYEGYFRSFNIVETPDFETVDYDFVFVAEKGTPVTFMQRVLGMYSGYTSVVGDAMNVMGV